MTGAAGSRPFLRARWESLVLANFACPRALLEPLVPAGTVLDPWRGVDLVSLVGLLFRDASVKGVSLPGLRTFPQVNLRFYVRRPVPSGDDRKGVVFIREIVPRRLIAHVARIAYNEPFVALPMDFRGALDPGRGGRVEYRWRRRGARFALGATVAGAARAAAAGSESRFVTEHYWGYARQRDGGTLEFRVTRPRWDTWDPERHRLSGPWSSIYGSGLGDVLSGAAHSVLAAAGSEVEIHRGNRIA